MKLKHPPDKISIIILVIISILLAGLLSSCSSTLYKNTKKINITHVLAITELGDTLKIPIEAIRPNVIYNVMGYSYGIRPYYYNRPYNSTYDFYPYNYGNNNINYSPSNPRPSNNSGSGANVSSPVLSNPPVATNPVTNGGGGKKKNN